MAFFPNSWIIETDKAKVVPQPATSQRHLESIPPLTRRGSLSFLRGCSHSDCQLEGCHHDDIYPHHLLRECENRPCLGQCDNSVYAPLPPVTPKSHPRILPVATAAPNAAGAPSSAIPQKSTTATTARQQRPRDRYPSQFPTSWLLGATPNSPATPLIAGYEAPLWPAAPSPQTSFASIPTTASSFPSPPTPNTVAGSQPIFATGGDLPIRALNILLHGAGAEHQETEAEVEERGGHHEDVRRTTLAALADLKERTSVEKKEADMIEMWVESQSFNHEAESILGCIQAVASSERMARAITPGATEHIGARACGLTPSVDADTAMADDSDDSDDSGLGDAPHVGHDTGDEYSVYSDLSD